MAGSSRHPEGGALTLTDPALFGASGKPRTFRHVDPPLPASAAGVAPPSNAGEAGRRRGRHRAGVKTPSPVKTGEADAALGRKQDQAAATVTPEKAPSKVAASRDSPRFAKEADRSLME